MRWVYDRAFYTALMLAGLYLAWQIPLTRSIIELYLQALAS